MPAKASTSTEAVTAILIYRCDIRTSGRAVNEQNTRIFPEMQGAVPPGLASLLAGNEIPLTDFRQHDVDHAVAPDGVELERLRRRGAEPAGERPADHRFGPVQTRLDRFFPDPEALGRLSRAEALDLAQH